MDMKSPGKSQGNRVFSKPSAVRGPGKVAMGFQSFKFVNPNIKLVKQVEVKTSMLKARLATQAGTAAMLQPSSSPVEQLSTADELRQMRERIQAKKKLHEKPNTSSSAQKSPKDGDSASNGICLKQDTKPSNEQLASDACSKEIPSKPSKTECSPTRSTSKKDKKWQLEEKSDGKSSRPEPSMTSSSRSRKNVESRKNRERSRSPRKEKDSCSSKRRTSDDRSRSPRREKHSHSSKRTSSADDKPSSPHHVKEFYSSKSTSKRSSHHRQEKTSARKYSASSQPREIESSKSNSRGHHSDRRRPYEEDTKHTKRSSSHRKASPERKSSFTKKGAKTTDSYLKEYSSSKKDSSRKASKSPERSGRWNWGRSKPSSGFKEQAKIEKSRDSDKMFSKLSFDFSINEEEEYEMENGSPNHAENQDKIKDMESLSVIDEIKTEEEDSEIENASVSDECRSQGRAKAIDICKQDETNEICSFNDVARAETSVHDETPQKPSLHQPTFDEIEYNSGGDTPCQDERDSQSPVYFEEMNSRVNYKTISDLDASPEVICQLNAYMSPKTPPTGELKECASPKMLTTCSLNQCAYSAASHFVKCPSPKAPATSPLNSPLNDSPLNESMSPKSPTANSLSSPFNDCISPKTPAASLLDRYEASQEPSIANETALSNLASAYGELDDVDGGASVAPVDCEVSEIQDSTRETLTQFSKNSPKPAEVGVLCFPNGENNVDGNGDLQNSCDLVPHIEDDCSSMDPLQHSGSDTTLSPDKIQTPNSESKDNSHPLLRANFETEDATNVLTLCDLNGVVSLNKTENLLGLPDFGKGECGDSIDEALNLPEPVENLEKVEELSHDPLPVGGKEILKESHADPSILGDLGIRLGTGRPEAMSCADQKERVSYAGTSVVSSANVATHCSIKASPYKLKLHDTTKTPLPAKKSYILQQAQSDSEHSLANISDPGNHPLVSKRPSQSDSDIGAPISISDMELKEARPDIITSLVPQEDAVITETQCERNASSVGLLMPLVPDTGLTRQDSSGSSTNDIDNEEGPRRSARIRTKKTERTLKRLSVETAPQAQSVDSQKEVFENTGDLNCSHLYISERHIKDLSGKDLFKARINLATDVVDDCPDLFDLLDENLYLTSLKKSRARKEIRRMVCDCALEDNPDPGGPCGDNCLNRLLMIECSSRCLYGDKCANKRFQHRMYAPTEVFKTGFKGWGIRASCDIGPGYLIMEYCGEVVDQREFTRRSLEYSKSNHAHFYFMALSQDEVIDATYKGNSSRFINHSCDPNAETQKWTVNGRLRVGFFTVKDVKKGEEITFDYQFERYGKVAQKCYCGTAKCRGYLGKAPDEDDENGVNLSKLLSDEALSMHDDVGNHVLQDKETRKNKKLTLFTDNTMEKDISKLSGGLRSSKEVLSLSRLMVRCDTQAQRVMCLEVLKETTSQTRLKTFLQFHGLSIIWSWMVDISGEESQDAFALKLEIINTLCMLPISNKNVIEDSKVLSVVQRWAKPERDDSKAEESKDSAADEGIAEKVSDKEKVGEEGPNVTVVSAVNETTSSEEVPKESPSEERQHIDQTSDAANGNEKVLEAASSLLESWKDLREIYRIPKRQKPLPSPSRDSNSNSRDNSMSRTSSPKQPAKTEDGDKANRNSRSRRDSSQERYRDGFNRSWDPDNQFSPSSSNSGENRRETVRRKRRLSVESDDGSRESGHVPWHCRPPKFSTKMSRQEYRRRFEKDIEKRELEKKRLEEQMEVEIAQNAMYSMNSQQFIGGMSEEIQSLIGSDVGMAGPTLPGSTTFTPSGFSGNLIQINPIQPAPLMDPYMNVAVAQQQMGLMPQVVQHPGQNPYMMQMPPQNFNVPGMYNQDPNLQGGLPAGYTMVNHTMHNQQQMAAMGQQVIGHTVSLIQPPQQPPAMQLQQQTIQPQQQQTNNVTILGSQNGQAIVLLTAEQLQKLTQGNSTKPLQPTDSAEAEPSGRDSANDKKSKQSEEDAGKGGSKVPEKLPPRWKTATDTEGRTYYFHEISRQTQWDPPTWDGSEEDMRGKKDAEMDLSSTPTHDERRLKSSKNKVDEITEEGRKAKDSFRLKMSHFVVQCLGSFRKPDQKVGRITSTEDFKHLARKLTHNVMQKELKQVRVWEDLDFNANVKHKTKEYVKKYMNRVGPVYRIRDDT